MTSTICENIHAADAVFENHIHLRSNHGDSFKRWREFSHLDYGVPYVTV